VTVLDQFVACFEGLEDLRTGNAGAFESSYTAHAT
jgi:hypothetical protein